MVYSPNTSQDEVNLFDLINLENADIVAEELKLSFPIIDIATLRNYSEFYQRILRLVRKIAPITKKKEKNAS